MALTFPINPLHGQQYTDPQIPITWQWDSGRFAWRIVRGGPSWTDIVGKPIEFPPADHEHPIAEVTGLQDILDVKQDITARGQPSGYASLGTDGIVPLAQLPSNVGGDWNSIANKPTEFPPSPHSHPVAQISDSGTTGQQLVRAPDSATARSIIGAIGPDDNARVGVKKNDILLGTRRAINFKEGTNVTLAVVDDVAQEEVEVTINSSGGSGGAAYTVSETKPAAPFANDLWLDAATGLLFTYYNDGSTSQWIESLPYIDSMPPVFPKIDFPAAPIDAQVFEPFPTAKWKWSASRGVWFAVGTSATGGSYTKTEADAKFVDIAGDVMTGALGVVHPPTANVHATSKQYVDAQDLLRVVKSGDTMTGALILPAAAPTLDTHATNKAYVDTKVGKAGGVDGQMTGSLKITAVVPHIILNKTATGVGGYNQIQGSYNDKTRWLMRIGDTVDETGANAGSNFSLLRYADDGTTLLSEAMNINRVDNITKFSGDLVTYRYYAPTTGLLQFGNSNTKYLFYDGTSFLFNGAGVSAPSLYSGGTIQAVGAISGNGITSSGGGTFASLGVSGTSVFQGDITVWRAATPTTGMVAFGNTGAKYLFFDGSSFHFAGGGLTVPTGLNTFYGGFTSRQDATIFREAALGTGLLYFGNSTVKYVYMDGSNFQFNGAQVYAFGATGNVIAAVSGYKPGGGPWLDFSDARIKTVVGDYQSGLAEVTQLHPVVYVYKANEVTKDAPRKLGPDGKEEEDKAVPLGEPNPRSLHYEAATAAKQFIGLIAQEVEGVMPELITSVAGTIDGKPVTDLRNMDTGPLIFALINAVKELKARVEQLEAAA